MVGLNNLKGLNKEEKEKIKFIANKFNAQWVKINDMDEQYRKAWEMDDFKEGKYE